MSKPHKNWLEWTVFGLSLLLVIGTLGYLAYDGAIYGDDPPAIEVRLGAPEQRESHYAVPVEVSNHGDMTAEGVLVEVTLVQGQEREQSQFEVAFLPRRATRTGWVTFQANPATGQLEGRALGYEQP